MRQFTTTHTVYSFDELSDDAKAKALEDQRQFEYDTLDGWLPDEMEYQLGLLLKKHKIVSVNNETPKIYYSLSYSQGDGAMFEGEYSWRGYRASIRQAGHYYHYNSKEITLETAFGNEAKQSKQEEFNDIYVSICKELERAGYAAIEGTTTDEALAENINANGYEFYEDGRVA